MCSRPCAISAAPRARARRPKSSPSPARSARPAPRRRCGWRFRADGETHASAASYNNHWGVPLSLARCPASAKYAVFEIGMNHAGEITPLTQAGAPACGDRHGHRAGASGIFRLAGKDRRRQGGNLFRARAGRRRRAQPRQRAICAARHGRQGGRRHAHRFVRRDMPRPTRGCCVIRCRPNARPSRRASSASGVTYKLGAPGRHLVLNSLAVLAAAALVGADLALAALALNNLKPASGRGTRATLRVPGGSALLIDESYNANPASMAAAIALLGQAPVGKQRPPHCRAGRHAGTGARKAPALHRGLAEPIEAAGVDLVFCSGPLMHALWEALPSGDPGRLCRDGGGAGAGRARRHPRRRCGDGEGFAGLENGADRQGAGTAIPQAGRARAGGGSAGSR